MKRSIIAFTGTVAVVSLLSMSQAAATPLETARDYCSNTMQYEIGSNDYEMCYAAYIWGHCDGKGEKPGTPGHSACTKALANN